MSSLLEKITLTWCWRLESELHCGSGVSRSGHADHVVYLNADRQPEISGDAVKGALRMSAEHVLDWLDCRAEYERKTTEPRSWPLALLFGESAQAHFEPAVATVAPNQLPVRASTALDAKYGVAKDETLRLIELVPAGTEFRGKCTLWLRPEYKDIVMTLLAAALAATDTIGGKRGIGWGRLQLKTASFHIPTPIENWLQPTCLEKLQTASKESWPNLEYSGSQTTGAQDSQWYCLEVTLYEPTCIGSKPSISNQTTTESYIPANTLRGALLANWKRQGYAPETLNRWLGSHTRWLPAVPVEDNQACVPVPLSFLCEKHESGFGGDVLSPHGLHDSLNESPPPNKEDNGKSIQWRGVGGGWMKQQNASHKTELPRLLTMHVARDYITGSKRSGALFSREHIAASSNKPLKFLAHAYLPADVDLPSTAQEVYIGKRNSAGHGRATLRAVKGQSPVYTKRIPPEKDTCVYVAFVTPVLYRGDNGFWKTALSKEDWQALCGGALLLKVASRSASKLELGWMNRWKHGITPTVCVAAGSVFKLVCPDLPTAQQVRKHLNALSGLGARHHEGFGQFVVDPIWLGDPKSTGHVVNEAKPPQPPSSKMHPQKWPGCISLTVSEVEAIAKQMETMIQPKHLEKLGGPLQDLASRARNEGATAQGVMAHCKKMAERTNSKGKERSKNPWKGLKEGQPCHTFLAQCYQHPHPQSLDVLRFALEALLIRCAKEAV